MLPCCKARQQHGNIDARKGLDRSQEHLASSQHPIPRSPDRPASAPARAHLGRRWALRSEEHTSELQSLAYLVCRLLLEKKKNNRQNPHITSVNIRVIR